MRRSIGTDPLEADEIVIAEIFGRSLAGGIDRAVVEQAAGCRDYGGSTKAELRTLTQARFTVVEYRFGAWKGAVAGLCDEGRGHPAGRRPAGVDRQHSLHEVLVERRASEQPAAAPCNERPVFAQRRHRRSGRPVGGEPAAGPRVDLGEVCRSEPVPAQHHAVGTALGKLDRPTLIADSFGPTEPPGSGIPGPRCQMRPTMARNGQLQVDRPWPG